MTGISHELLNPLRELRDYLARYGEILIHFLAQPTQRISVDETGP